MYVTEIILRPLFARSDADQGHKTWCFIPVAQRETPSLLCESQWLFFGNV